MASTITADTGAVSGSAGLKSSADSSGVLALATGTGTTAVTIDASQNVGIGTGSPVSQLHLVSASESGMTIYKSAVGAGNVRIVSQGGGSALAFGSDQATGTTERMRIDSSGNVGIGTSSPAAKLNTSGSSAAGYVGNYFDNTASNGYVRLDLRIGSNGANGTASVKYAPGVFMAIGPDSNDTTTPLVFLTNNATERARIDSSGNFMVATTTPAGKFTLTDGLTMYVANSQPYTSANAAATVLKIGSMTSGRSISTSGTNNASGADYAEYMTKAGDFVLAKGDIVGIDANGKLTNVFADSVAFVVKSTNPSYVGGDTWGNGLEGDELEAARQTVDRVAFSGQVPVNVTGATAGQYIVPENDNGAIKGVAVSSPTFEQYQLAVGKVIAIEDDGRARIIVKVA